jgi:predicted MFS family arabinose efflux permease
VSATMVGRQPAERTHSLRVLTVVLAVACGLAVANIYYSQPLLDLIARSLHTSEAHAAVVVTATQLGYALGLLLVLPLGDLWENRALTSRTLLVTAAVLAGAAAAPNLATFLVLSVLVGVTSVVAQILVPLAAHLAPEHERGLFVGRVMSGLLLGILLARTVSSLLAALWGWRSIYVVSAVLMLATALALRLMLPQRRPEHTASYPQLLGSMLSIARSQPVLRRRAVGQALMFAAFSTFWTSIAFQLIRVHHFSQTGIAIFALVGAGGAAAAPIAGKVGDRGHGRLGRGLAFALAAVAMVLAGLGGGNVVVLAVAAVLLDLAVQSHQVLSQRDIYRLDPEARARINSVFMGSVFLGGAAGSAISGLIFEHLRWSGAAFFGAALAAVGLLLWIRRDQVGRTTVPAR